MLSHAEHPEVSFARRHVDESTFLSVLADVATALTDAGIDHLFIGGVPSAVYGRARWSTDIDVLVRPEDRHSALTALADAGFATQETDPDWIFKATCHGVLVDVIFKSTGSIFLDAEMLDRGQRREFRGVPLKVLSPEDLVILKVLAHDEPTSRHWFDAMAVITLAEIDWEYLLDRARRSPRRILSLLLYAQGNDITVPNRVVNTLIRMLAPEGIGVHEGSDD